MSYAGIGSNFEALCFRGMLDHIHGNAYCCAPDDWQKQFWLGIAVERYQQAAKSKPLHMDASSFRFVRFTDQLLGLI
jgi:hypothetical protein